jgi:hypothetical protein
MACSPDGHGAVKWRRHEVAASEQSESPFSGQAARAAANEGGGAAEDSNLRAHRRMWGGMTVWVMLDMP